MQTSLELSFQGLSRSDAMERLIREEVEKLNKTCGFLVSCRVGVTQEQQRRQTANPFRIRIEMRLPPSHDIVVNHQSGLKEFADDLPATIKNAFKSARRRLRKQVEKQQGEVKKHPFQEVTALVTEINRAEGDGMLRSVEGDEIYFQRNSVLNNNFDRLEIGTGVHFAAELRGEGEWIASTVQIADKPGVYARD